MRLRSTLNERADEVGRKCRFQIVKTFVGIYRSPIPLVVDDAVRRRRRGLDNVRGCGEYRCAQLCRAHDTRQEDVSEAVAFVFVLKQGLRGGDRRRVRRRLGVNTLGWRCGGRLSWRGEGGEDGLGNVRDEEGGAF